jgi:hypothetical protein
MPEDRILEYAEWLTGTKCLNRVPVLVTEDDLCLRLFDDDMTQWRVLASGI